MEKITTTARDQAKALAELTDECPPWAPSVAIVYWRYAPLRRHDASWKKHWERLVPVVSFFGPLPAAKLTPAAWAECANFFRSQGLGENTINISLGRAKQMLTWAVREGLLKFSPLDPAERGKALGRRTTATTPAQLDDLLAAADDVVDRTLAEGDDDGRRAKLLRIAILAEFDSMLRPGEVLSLRLERIGEEGAVILTAAETKSGRDRAIVLTPRTLEAIRDLHGAARRGYVMAWEDGSPVADRTLGKWFARAREIAGVQAAPGDGVLQQRDNRAGGASRADQLGARPRAIQTALGHASFSTTEIYLRTSMTEDAHHVADVMSGRTGPRMAPRRSARRAGVVPKKTKSSATV